MVCRFEIDLTNLEKNLAPVSRAKISSAVGNGWNHRPDFDSFKVLDREEDWARRQIKEGIYILKNKTIKRDEGWKVNSSRFDTRRLNARLLNDCRVILFLNRSSDHLQPAFPQTDDGQKSGRKLSFLKYNFESSKRNIFSQYFGLLNSPTQTADGGREHRFTFRVRKSDRAITITKMFV